MRKRSHRRRGRVRRVVIVVPSLFTLANLFFGFWSMVLASQGEFYQASWWIIIAGILDLLDGMSARVSKTGSRFGAELDSLVDLVSFGVAPGVLMYFVLLSSQGPFAWVFSYAFAVCVALRLARFNAQPSEGHHRTFTGMPSTAAGMTLAAYYPFTQTPFFSDVLSALPWSQIIIFLMIGLSLVMVSNVAYARLPRIGFRSVRGWAGTAVIGTILWFGIFNRDVFFFPLGIAYLTYGLARWAMLAVIERGDDEGTSDESSTHNLQLHAPNAPRRAGRGNP